MDILKEGDIIKLEKGDKVYVDIPYHFIYENKKGVYDQLSSHDVTIGNTVNGFDTDYLIDKWVVYKTVFDGGSSGGGMNGHDDYHARHFRCCRGRRNHRHHVRWPSFRIR